MVNLAVFNWLRPYLYNMLSIILIDLKSQSCIFRRLFPSQRDVFKNNLKLLLSCERMLWFLAF
jgi:hypothetical protein